MTDRVPEAGDIVWVVFDPIVGTEQAGRRPAIVLTDFDYNQITGRAVVCPITKSEVDWPTIVAVPSGMKTTGYVLADQIRAVNRKGRSFRFIEHAPEELLEELRVILRQLLGLMSH